MNKKGDVGRYILWFIVLLIITIVLLALFYSTSIKMIEEILKQKIFGMVE